MLAVAVGSTVAVGWQGVCFQKTGGANVGWLSLWARQSLWARGKYFSQISPLVGACGVGGVTPVGAMLLVIGCRCGLGGRSGLEGSIFKIATHLVRVMKVVGCCCGLDGRCGLLPASVTKYENGRGK